MGRPVMLTIEDRDVKGFTWAIAPALTSLGYLLILLVSIFPFWVRLVNEESQEVFFSGLFENCFHIKCWKPRPLSTLSEDPEAQFCVSLHQFPHRGLRLPGLVAARPGDPESADEAQPPTVLHTVALLRPGLQYPSVHGGCFCCDPGTICLIQEIACPRCHLLPISQSTEDTQEISYLENLDSLGGELSSTQKETLLKEETII
ncbi:transmembrane protein 225B isoform X5 [Ovis canadensis]|uniref:transmembrane protein 225B isoform X5 n=1 Tax=Ovis canadensis TaxID=37174 RepID=UPI0038B5985F